MDIKIEIILRDFLIKNCLPQKGEIEFGNDDNLFNTGIIDSAGLIYFVGYIEKKFNIDIPDEDLIPEKFISVNSISQYIESKITNCVTQS